MIDNLLITQVSELVQNKFRGREKDYWNNLLLPLDNLKELFSLGLMSITINPDDKEFNYIDLDTYYTVIRTIARVSPSTAHCYQLHCHTLWTMQALCSKEQRKKYLLPLLSEFRLLANPVSEPGRVGMYSLKTILEKTDNAQYVLNGNKNYGTNVTEDTLILVMAKLSTVDDQNNKNQLFIIDPKTHGVTINKDWYTPTGMRACISPELIFENVQLNSSELVGGPDAYYNDRWACKFHLSFASNYLGTVEGAFEYVIRNLIKREKTQNLFIQMRLGELKTKLALIQNTYEKTLSLIDKVSEEDFELLALETKLVCSSFSTEIMNGLIKLAGPTALFDTEPLGRYANDLMIHSQHIGLDVTYQVIGKSLLNVDYDTRFNR